jgi:hypothetical protein
MSQVNQNIISQFLNVVPHKYSDYVTKNKNNVEFFNVDIIDNKAQWVYDNKIYYADVINGKINNKTTRKIEI